MTEREKVDPSTLELRPKPRPVTRLNKNALMLAAGGAALVIFAATSIALKPPRAASDAPLDRHGGLQRLARKERVERQLARRQHS